MTQQTEALLEEAKRQLFCYPETTGAEDIKYIIKRVIKAKSTPKRDRFFWPHAMLAQALEEAGDVDTLGKYYGTWLSKGLPVYNIDGVMNGYSLLYLYEKQNDASLFEAGETLLQYLLRYKAEMTGTVPYRKHHPTHIYADGIGMTAPFLCRYGKLAEKKEAAALAVEQIQSFLENGMDEAADLPYHGYDTKTKEKFGIIGWGRAVGWFLLALADSLEFLEDSGDKKEITKRFQKLIDAAIPYLRKDGYYSWQLQAVEGPKDTSATAMIACAIQKGTAIGVLKEDYEEQLAKMEKAILSSTRDGKIYDCSGECEGFSQYPQVYGAYPWSLGPGLRFLLIRQKYLRAKNERNYDHH